MALIIDMKLPEGCINCPLNVWDDENVSWVCILTDKQANEFDRPDWCPIIGETSNLSEQNKKIIAEAEEQINKNIQKAKDEGKNMLYPDELVKGTFLEEFRWSKDRGFVIGKEGE